MSYTTLLNPIRPGIPEDARSEHTVSQSRRTFLGGVVTATTLGLVLSVAVPAAFSQQPQLPPRTDAYGGNLDAQFAESPPSEPSLERIGDNPRARILRWNEIAMDCTALDHTPRRQETRESSASNLVRAERLRHWRSSISPYSTP